MKVEGMMNNLISRKALCDYALNQKDKSVTPNDIMRFPSAQPEIIRCRDCKHRYLDGMIWNCPFGLSGGEDFFCAYGAKEGDPANKWKGTDCEVKDESD